MVPRGGRIVWIDAKTKFHDRAHREHDGRGDLIQLAMLEKWFLFRRFFTDVLARP